MFNPTEKLLANYKKLRDELVGSYITHIPTCNKLLVVDVIVEYNPNDVVTDGYSLSLVVQSDYIRYHLNTHSCLEDYTMGVLSQSYFADVPMNNIEYIMQPNMKYVPAKDVALVEVESLTKVLYSDIPLKKTLSERINEINSK